MLGDVGGFNDIVLIVLTLVMDRYTRKMFEWQLVRESHVKVGNSRSQTD